MSQMILLDGSNDQRLMEKFNSNKPTIAFSCRPVGSNKIRLVIEGRAPTNFGKKKQGSHIFAMAGTFRILQLMLKDLTVDEAVDKVCSFHSTFKFFHKVSYGENSELIYGDIYELIRKSDAIINEFECHRIYNEMKCPFIEEYLTICSYILNHLPETTVKTDVKNKNNGEGDALQVLIEMNDNGVLNDDVLIKNLTKLIDSEAIEKLIELKKSKDKDVIPVVLHQILYLHFLMQQLDNLRYHWLRSENLIDLGSNISNRLVSDLQNIIFTNAKQESISEKKQMIKDALDRLREYNKLEDWYEENRQYHKFYDLPQLFSK